MNLLDLETNERKNLSLWMMFGGAAIFTIFAAIGLWLVSANLQYVFYLAVLAHVQIITIMTGFIAQLVKRRITAGKDGITISDSGTEPAQGENNV
jgi:CDP-diglyceride synthetase